MEDRIAQGPGDGAPESQRAFEIVGSMQLLRATPAVVRSLLQNGLPDAIERPVDEGWSAKDVLAHLRDVDDVIAERIQRIVREDRPFIRSIDPPARLRERLFTQLPTPELLDEFDARRAASLEMLGALTEQELARVGEHDTAGEISAANLVSQWAYHDLMHVQQMTTIIQASLLPEMGNTRRFYFDV